MATLPDINDPCAMVTYLKTQYLALLGGGAPISVRFADREVKYSTGNIEQLAAEILRFEGLCAKSQGMATRRFAGRLGAYR